MLIEPIAHIKNGYKTKFAIPRQSGIAAEKSDIVFTAPYRDKSALRGIAGYSHLWLIWDFSESHTQKWSPTVRPPRLGGNTRVGVFATRSPYRPNPIGLSCVRLIGMRNTPDGTVLTVEGADLMDGTPIFDIKPYISYTDSVADAVCGFADEVKNDHLLVCITDTDLQKVPHDRQKQLVSMLSGDPRPSYQHDADRIYGFEYADLEIRFKVDGITLTVVSVSEAK